MPAPTNNVHLKRVEDWDAAMPGPNGCLYGEPGQLRHCVHEDGRHAGYVIACPGCGELGSIDELRWVVTSGDPTDIEHLTLSPSVHCQGCCGWHGWFRNGEAISV